MNKRFKNRSHFAKEYDQHYHWLLRNKPDLLDKYFPINRWTLEKCKIEALKYYNKKDWIKNSPSSYRTALKKNWLKICCGHMISLRRTWTFTRCKKEALKYNKKCQWEKQSPNSYSAAIYHNWLEKCCLHMKKNRPENIKVRCIETDEIFNINEVAKKINVSFSRIAQSIRKKHKCKGLTFVYVDEK